MFGLAIGWELDHEGSPKHEAIKKSFLKTKEDATSHVTLTLLTMHLTLEVMHSTLVTCTYMYDSARGSTSVALLIHLRTVRDT